MPPGLRSTHRTSDFEVRQSDEESHHAIEFWKVSKIQCRAGFGQSGELALSGFSDTGEVQVTG